MRIARLAALFCVLPLAALAQVPVLHAAPGDVAAALAKAKSLPAMTPQPIVTGPGYRAMLEHRKVPTPASLHETDDEFVEVIAGSGTIVIGGTLKDQARRNETNLSGSGIEGGKSYAVAKGDYFFIPAGTAHYFASMGADGLSIISLHVPHQAGK